MSVSANITTLTSSPAMGLSQASTDDGIWVGYIILCWFEIMMILLCLVALVCHCGRIQYWGRREHRHTDTQTPYISNPIEDEGSDRPGYIEDRLSLP